MPELRQRLGLDLADPLPGEGELPPDLLQRARLAGEEAEAQRQDLLLPVGQRVEHPPEVLLAEREGCRLEGPLGLGVLDEVPKLGVLVADGLVDRHRLGEDAERLPDLVRRHLGGAGDLVDGRLPPEGLHQLGLHLADPVQRLHHVDRDADGAGLVGDGASDRLADPPGCVGRELEAPAVVELLDRPHETEVALLDEVEQGQARRRVLLGDGHDEAQVRLDEPPLGGPAGVDLLLVVLTLLRRQLALGLGHVRLGRIARLDGLGKLDLVDVGQERVLADLPEVLPHKVLMRCLLLLEIVAGARLVVGVAFSSSHVGDPCRSRTERPEPLVRSPVRVPWRGEAESPSVAAT